MKRIFQFGISFVLAAYALTAVPAQKPVKDLKPLGKTVWNLEGGAFFATDGRIPNGPCFRLTGQATAPEFFENLKRIEIGRAHV